jgi:hypothetical protein
MYLHYHCCCALCCAAALLRCAPPSVRCGDGRRNHSLREHRTRKLNELLAAQPAHMRAPLLAALARDLEDLGMRAAESVAARVRGKKRGVDLMMS